MTVFLLPHSKGKVRRLRLTRVSVAALALFFLFCATYSAWLISDYRSLKNQMRLLARYQKENEHHHRQFLLMAERISQLKKDVEDFKAYYHNIKLMLDRVTGDERAQVPGIGGSDSLAFRSDLSMDGSPKGLVRLMHHFLDELNVEIDEIELKAVEVNRFLRHGITRHAQGSDAAISFISVYNRQNILKQLKAVAIELGLEPGLALGMAKVESGYNPKRVSPKGAVGVLQVMPYFAWREFSVPRKWLFNPHVNIRVGLTWMKSLLNRFDQDLDLALAAYNAGASRVVKAGYTIPPIRETQAYVRKVKEAMKNEG